MTTTKGKAHIQQAVAVEFLVEIEADEADLTMPLDDLRARIEAEVRERLGKVLLAATTEVYARRGPTGYRYFPPEDDRKYGEEKRAGSPIKVSLTDLGFKETE